MRPRDLFGVALRVLGIWFVYDGCYAGLYLGMKQAEMQLNSQVSMSPATSFWSAFIWRWPLSCWS
jgi:hypothetical protein